MQRYDASPRSYDVISSKDYQVIQRYIHCQPADALKVQCRGNCPRNIGRRTEHGCIVRGACGYRKRRQQSRRILDHDRVLLFMEFGQRSLEGRHGKSLPVRFVRLTPFNLVELYLLLYLGSRSRLWLTWNCVTRTASVLRTDLAYDVKKDTRLEISI